MWKKVVKVIILLLLIAALAAAALMIVRTVTAVVSVTGKISEEPDPMFAEPAETVTRPPELDAEEVQTDHPTLDDYVDEIQSPVDKTAEQLAEEAKNAK